MDYDDLLVMLSAVPSFRLPSSVRALRTCGV